MKLELEVGWVVELRSSLLVELLRLACRTCFAH